MAFSVRLPRARYARSSSDRKSETSIWRPVDRACSRFLSVVSHELRTPLSLIVGLSDMILREQRGKPQLPDVMLHDMERIYTSAQHLGQLIGDVLDLASSEAGQLRLLREPLDLADVLHAAAQIGEQMAMGRPTAVMRMPVHLSASGPAGTPSS